MVELVFDDKGKTGKKRVVQATHLEAHPDYGKNVGDLNRPQEPEDVN